MPLVPDIGRLWLRAAAHLPGQGGVPVWEMPQPVVLVARWVQPRVTGGDGAALREVQSCWGPAAPPDPGGGRSGGGGAVMQVWTGEKPVASCCWGCWERGGPGHSRHVADKASSERGVWILSAVDLLHLAESG